MILYISLCIVGIIVVGFIVYYVAPDKKSEKDEWAEYIKQLNNTNDKGLTLNQINSIKLILHARRIEESAFLKLCNMKFRDRDMFKEGISPTTVDNWIIKIEDLSRDEAERFIEAYKLPGMKGGNS